jgi:CubicO group peptidase (beta-lactamase class C family)
MLGPPAIINSTNNSCVRSSWFERPVSNVSPEANAKSERASANFCRLGGVWNGQQLLPQGFVDYVHSPNPTSDEGRGPVYGRGQVWLARGQGFDLPADTFMLHGHLRQLLAIIPSRKLVVLRMGVTREDIGYSNAMLLHSIVAAGF